MSQQNVEIATAAYEKVSRGGRLDAAFEFLAPEVEFHVSGAFPDLDAVYGGHEGVRRLNDQLNEPWEQYAWVSDRFNDVGDQVVVRRPRHGGRRDGIVVHAHDARLWTIRDGQVVQIHDYANKAEALEAVGLSE